MALQSSQKNRFIQEMETASFIPGWDIPWIPDSKNSIPRYALDYSNSDYNPVLGFEDDLVDYLSQFKGYKHNIELRRFSFIVPTGSVFRKSYSSELFSVDKSIDNFRNFILEKKPELKKLKEYVFEEGGLVDPIRTIGDITGNKKEDVKAAYDWAKFLVIGGGAYLLFSKISGSNKK